jgi:hypothetical protein
MVPMTADGAAAPDSEMEIVRDSTEVVASNNYMDEDVNVRDSSDSSEPVSHHYSSPSGQPGEESDPAVMSCPFLQPNLTAKTKLRDNLFNRLKQNSSTWLASVLGNSRGGFGDSQCGHSDRLCDEELMSMYADMDVHHAIIQDLKYQTLKQAYCLIDDAYQHAWTEFDWWLHRAWQWERSQWTIQDWPNDCKLILKAGMVDFYLGSIAAAWHVSQGNCHGIVPAAVPFACVISMNDDDQQRPGEPSRDEWAKCFEELGIKNLRYGGYDERVSASETQGTWHWAAKKADFKRIWRQMIKDFATWWDDHHFDSQMVGGTSTGPVAVLVHCYGGVNRSTAALICLLVVWTGQPAMYILQLVLKEKAGGGYWQDRLYMLEALLEFSEEVLCL